MVERRQYKGLLQKQHLYCSPAISKSSKFPKNGSWVVLRFLLIILKGWLCFLFTREHFLSFKNFRENLKLSLF